LKVTDLPEDAASMLKVTITDPKPIERAADDVETAWNDIKDSRAVRNVGSSAERWVQSPEVKNIQKLDKEFLATERGQRMVAEWEDVFRTLDEAVYHNDQGIHIDNDDV